MPRGRCRFAVQTGRYAFFALVEVDVSDSGGSGLRIVPPHRAAGQEHWSDRWAEGAVVGAEVALGVLNCTAVVVTFSRVVGSYTDTSGAAMAASAFAAVLDSRGGMLLDNVAIAFWHVRHGFRFDEVPTPDQLLELVARA